MFEFLFNSKTVPLFVKIGWVSIPAGLYERLMPRRLKNYIVRKSRLSKQALQRRGT